MKIPKFLPTDPKGIPKKIPKTITSDLPDFLKDHANYDKVQKMIVDTFISTCNHSDMAEWAACPKCTEKMLERRKLMKKLGFKNAAQYLQWKKIHEYIKHPPQKENKAEFYNKQGLPEMEIPDNLPMSKSWLDQANI